MSESLLKYENPVATSSLGDSPTNAKLKQQQSADKVPSILQTDDVLAAILPPKYSINSLNLLTVDNGKKEANCGFKRSLVHLQAD